MTAAVGGYFDLMQQRFRRDVPPIDVRRVPSHIAGFIDDLFTDSSVTKPVDDLYIGTHADGDGFLFVSLFRGAVDAIGHATDITDYEVLDQALMPARPAKIPDSLVGYHRGTPPAADPAPTHSVHIKGCNIGRDRFSPRPRSTTTATSTGTRWSTAARHGSIRPPPELWSRQPATSRPSSLPRSSSTGCRT